FHVGITSALQAHFILENTRDLPLQLMCYTPIFAAVLRRKFIEETSCQVGVSLHYDVEPQCAEVRVLKWGVAKW
ncbi:MAG: hypothetical protein OXG54_00810, partial [Gammaproteobacteria bacterium]|nr:hypothetical protein [Gammaproteobacteria bacterium]